MRKGFILDQRDILFSLAMIVGLGISFDDRSYTGGDEAAQENTPLIDIQEQPYRPIKTTGFIVLHIILTIIFIVLIVLVPLFFCQIFHPGNSDNCSSTRNETGYHIALYIHAGAYVVSLAFDRLYHHYQDLSRRDGYLEFYRQTRNLRRAPLFIISLGNAILVALIEVLEYHVNPSKNDKLYPRDFLTILTGVEVFIILIALVRYLVRTIKFNKAHARPDATLDDYLSTFVPSETAVTEIGFRDETYKENVLEKQADLIRYLRERNEHLSRLVLRYRQDADFQRDIPNNHL